MMGRDEYGRFTALTSGEREHNLVANASSDLLPRSILTELAGMQFINARDVDTNLGYTKKPKLDQYQSYYDRRGIAAVIVDAPAQTTWRNTPKITDGSEGSSTFMKGWDELEKRLKIFSYLERVDRLSGIGHYGVLLIGTKEGELSDKLESVNNPQDIIYLSVFSERYAEVKEYETNKNDSRFGRPKTYEIDMSSNVVKGFTKTKETVHHSRVIHIAEGLLENEVLGEPRLQKVYNRLEDLDKVVGSSAEGFWQNVVKGYALSTKEGFELDPSVKEAVKVEWQNWIHNLQRLITVEGMDFKELGAKPEDPESVFKVIIQLISGKTRIPQRVLLGSERGELASNQDQASWLGHISGRQTQFAEPQILRPLIDLFVDIKALDAPANGIYEVEWPGLFYLTDEEQASVYEKKANAIAKITGDQPLDMFDEAELREALGFPAERENKPPVSNVLDEDDPEVMEMFKGLKHANR